MKVERMVLTDLPLGSELTSDQLGQLEWQTRGDLLKARAAFAEQLAKFADRAEELAGSPVVRETAETVAAISRALAG